MNGTTCYHCGQQHPAGTTFCPVTGRPLAGAAQPPQGQPGGYPQPGHPQGQPGYPPQGQPGYPQGQPGYPPHGQPGYSPQGQAGYPQGQPGYPPHGQPGFQGQPGYPPPGQPGYPPPGQPGYPPQGTPGYAPSGQPGYPPPGQPGPGAYGAPPGYGAPGAPPGYAPAGAAYPPGAAGTSPFGAGKSIGAILTEAMQLYQKHLVSLLITASVLLGPAFVLESGARALILAPTVAVGLAAADSQRLGQKTAEQIQKQIQLQQQAANDPKKLQELQREQQKQAEELARSLTTTGTAAIGGLMATLLGLVAFMIGIAVIYGFAIPLTTGALTILIADRATGGNAGPGEAWKLLLKRLGKLLSATIPAFFLVLVGCVFCLVPGIVLGFLFTFVTPVVLLENTGGTAALKRSVALVKANVPQVLIMCIVFAAIHLVAEFMAGIFIPRSAFFVGGLVSDALMLLLLPLPILGIVLLYLDIRKQADRLDDNALRAGIEGLRRG